MAMTKRNKSDTMRFIHEDTEDLHERGSIDKKKEHCFDEACLTEVYSFTPDEIRTIREREHVSRDVFSHYLNVTPDLINKWEKGDKKPCAASLKLLSLVKKKGLSIIA